jgi:hypothetical protein
MSAGIRAGGASDAYIVVNGTDRISIDGSGNCLFGGKLTSSTGSGVNSPSARFFMNTATKLSLHLQSGAAGASPTNTQQYGISFSPSSGLTQAGVVISENNSDGTAVGIFCTNSYASGPQLRAFWQPDGHFVPGANNAYDLGSTSLRWRNIYTNDLHLSNGIGDYTIVEGEEDLFLVNNKSGKHYKFLLEQVDPSQVPPRAEVAE